jgi:hypothetical protein
MNRLGVLVVATTAACAGAHPRDPRPGLDAFVRMERTECLGRCPVYSVTLLEDGTVKYVGGRDAPPGTDWRKVDPAEVTEVMDAIDQLQPWTCAPGRIETDYPQSIVTLSRGGRVRRIVHDHGDPCAPRAMLWIEGLIDRAGGHPQLVLSVGPE